MAKAWPALDIHVPRCDPQLQELVLAELDDFQPTAIQESDESSWLRAFFASAESRTDAARALVMAFGHHLLVHAIDVEDDDWAERSQSDLRAVTVGRLIIAPPWDVPKRGRESFSVAADEKDSRPLFVVIRPSMGFGTGHHATTRLMLKAMQDIPMEGRTVLDIGCGSGVLAIAAAKLGAVDVVGIDIDPDALANAAGNAELNALAGKFRFEEADFRTLASPAGVVLANLTGAVLEQSASALAALLQPGGHLLVSGMMEEETTVLPTLAKYLTLHTVDQEGEWLCAVLQRSS